MKGASQAVAGPPRHRIRGTLAHLTVPPCSLTMMRDDPAPARLVRARSPDYACSSTLDSHASTGIWYAKPWAVAQSGNHRLARMNDASQSSGGGRSAWAARSIQARGGAGAPPFPKGRVLKAEEAAAAKALLGSRPRERALLIEYLHLLQDQEGCLPEGHLQALAEELRIPMAEIYEVATFYAHFDVVADGEPRPPAVTVRVCDSLSCMLAGAEQLLAALQGENMPGVRVLRAPASARATPRLRPRSATIMSTMRASPRSSSWPRGGETHPAMPSYQDL